MSRRPTRASVPCRSAAVLLLVSLLAGPTAATAALCTAEGAAPACPVMAMEHCGMDTGAAHRAGTVGRQLPACCSAADLPAPAPASQIAVAPELPAEAPRNVMAAPFAAPEGDRWELAPPPLPRAPSTPLHILHESYLN